MATATVETLELQYALADLPSSQHRAGLVGLLMVIDDLKKSNQIGCDSEITERGATIKITGEGLKAILDQIYAADEELQGSGTARKDQEPVKVLEEEFIDKKTKKTKIKKMYYYPVIIPKGSFLDYRDESDKKIWIKLWRDMVWQILRGVPATRVPFEDRAFKRNSNDSASLWKQLNQNVDRSVDLPSTYYVGAQASNAERVPFKDKGRLQFLLHFWPLVCQIYIPQLLSKDQDKDSDMKFEGFVLAIPDVCLLKSFKADYQTLLKNRSPQALGFRPKEAVIEVPEEAGLDAVRRLNEAVKTTAGKDIADVVFGFDIFHTSREGNNVRLLFSGRVEPEHDRDRDYANFKNRFTDRWFRRQRLINLLNRRSWHSGFAQLLGSLSLEKGLLSSFFAHDARVSFEIEAANHEGRIKMQLAEGKPVSGDEVCLESLVLKIVDGYLRQKLKDKYTLEWSKIQDNPSQKKEYNDRRESLGKECFYAIRSRTGEDFINYFASTICSVPHWMTQDEYSCITKTLYQDTEKIRTLSMLALSARIGREKKEGQADG